MRKNSIVQAAMLENRLKQIEVKLEAAGLIGKTKELRSMLRQLLEALRRGNPEFPEVSEEELIAIIEHGFEFTMRHIRRRAH